MTKNLNLSGRKHYAAPSFSVPVVLATESVCAGSPAFGDSYEAGAVIEIAKSYDL